MHECSHKDLCPCLNWNIRQSPNCCISRNVALQIRTRSVALTVPAYIAADLVRRDCPDASMALKSLDYPPVAAVTVSYPMSSIKQDRLDEARKLPGVHACAPKHAQSRLRISASGQPQAGTVSVHSCTDLSDWASG